MHDATKPAFQHARDVFNSAKQAHDSAKTAHEKALAEFKQAKANFDTAARAFKTRLELVKAEGNKRAQDRRALAEKAGIPSQYLDNVWVSHQAGDIVNFYFGGVGKANGPGHGHYVMDGSGKLTYKRDPFDPHGTHNFTANQADYFHAVQTESATESNEFGFRCRYKGLPAYVETGYDNRTGRQKINIYYGAPDGMLGQGHGHAIAYRSEPSVIVSDRPPR